MSNIFRWLALFFNLILPTLTPAVPSARQKIRVTRVIDGDTIEVEGGQVVRYLGMDAPETVDPNTPVQCFGKEASLENRKLVEGKVVELEKDVSETDKYGRELRYVWLNGTMVDQQLVKTGYARTEIIPPDIKYNRVLLAAEEEARSAKYGLWKKCQ